MSGSPPRSAARPAAPRPVGGWSDPVVALAGVGCLLASIQVLTLGLGVLGIRLGRPLAIALLAAAVGLSLGFASRLRSGPAAPAPAPAPPTRMGRVINLSLAALAAAAVLWALETWAELWVITASRDPIDWDGLYYHIPPIHEWVLQGRVGFVTGLPDVPWVNTPMGVEVASFFVHQLAATSRLVDAGNLWFWPLGAAALAVIASRLGVGGGWRWLAGALLATVPVFLGRSATAYIDPGLSAGVMAALAAACLLAFDESRPRGWLAALFGMTLGLTMGAKATGVFLAALIGLATAAVLARSGSAGSWRRRGALVGVAAAVALAVGGYWYLRNLIVTGNPLYPLQINLGEKIVFAGWDPGYFNDLELPEFLRGYPAWMRPFAAWVVGDGPVPGHPGAALGAVWLFGGVPATVYLWWRGRRGALGPVRRELAFLTLLVAVMFAVSPMSWRSRYVIWVHALGLPALVAVLYHATRQWAANPWHLVTVGLAAAVVGLGLRESRRTLEDQWMAGKELDAPARSTAFLSSVEVLFPGLLDTPGFRDALASPRIARGRWRTQYGPLLGGALALPLGQRAITVVPAHSRNFRDPFAEAVDPREPSVAELTALETQGIEWLIWDATGDGGIPASVRRRAAAHYVYRHAALAQVYHLVRLRGPVAVGVSDDH